MYGLGVLKGFGVTLKNFVRKPFTVQYPEERSVQHPRFRGQEFVWYEDRCTGCASCAKYCPLGIIRIVTDPDGGHEQEGGDYKVEVFDIDQGRCMYCGLCVEACPYDALHMGSTFEGATTRREDLVITMEVLNERPKHPSTWFRPQLEQQAVDPFAGAPVESGDAGREAYQWHPKRSEDAPGGAGK
ncbi:MAG: NADH-quinone oxidoreductase subunit I [Chloroflexi bacterium]|nr:NADH-quinone oxidoreductase subunit I [Chloroflexota bacterium]MCI0820974.1 NADH-quinone oxidoreductase subunit I [Chloroflexota bacterium]